jgi:hypothetical protein
MNKSEKPSIKLSISDLSTVSAITLIMKSEFASVTNGSKLFWSTMNGKEKPQFSIDLEARKAVIFTDLSTEVYYALVGYCAYHGIDWQES